MDNTARIEAAKQWNATACGELSGDKDSADYFLSVEKERYTQQAWQHGYFPFSDFPGKKVLEIGIGQGTDLMQFARSGAECFGVDITDNHLVLTQRNFDLQGKKVTLFKSDATNLPFDDNSLDCVYSFGVLHHIPEADKVVSEIFRVLKPGGRLMLALYYKWSAFHLFKKILFNGILRGWLLTKGYAGLLATIETGADGVEIKPYVKLYTKKDMRELLDGFSILDISVHQLKGDHFLPAAFGWRLDPLTPRLESRLGWYVACQAVKPA